MSDRNEYDQMNILSDYFQESARMCAAAGAHNLAPMEHWCCPELSRLWITKLLLNSGARVNINTYQLREGMYLGGIKEASQFKATVTHTVIRLLGGRRVLDWCAGWGDRLLGAMSCDDRLLSYYGVDPNPALHSGYLSMLETFLPTTSHPKYHLICEPFESCELPNDAKFDLIFTGPPYFTYERYTDAAGQSISSFPSFVDWMVKFLFASIVRSWRRLEEGGHMALNLQDTAALAAEGLVFTQPTIWFMDYAFPESEYSGVISFSGARVQFARPIWIWRKLAAVQGRSERLASASGSASSSASAGGCGSGGRLLLKHLPDVYAALHTHQRLLDIRLVDLRATSAQQ
eukprot:NODE_304_length_1819_cov_3.998305_g246_i0.p1 GENE.NODE_304_length_1819_cov_3.998305_g246_i0~~NODE_304_length_1819_cov_3.998305_g246_i0.p1  ORF type:complete len:346 (+),score=49.20 NODE_304_length_1819_cov_3.998305_g246_i0:676-1713(+)